MNSTSGLFGTNSSLSMGSIIDGTSSTIAFGENLTGTSQDSRGIFCGNGPTTSSIYFTQGPNSRIPDTFPSSRSCPANNPRNQPCRVESKFTLSLTEWIGASRSYHRGGVNVTLADGSTRFITDFIDLSVWRALGTRNGAEVVGEF